MNREITAAPPLLEQPTKVRYGVLAFACTLSMITYLDRVCFGTVAPYIQLEFALSDKQKGLLFTAFALAYAVFEVPTGWLGDVFGPRKTLIRIVVWWSAFTMLTGLIYPEMLGLQGAFLAMLSVRFLFGVGEAGAYPNIAKAFHNWFPFSERGSAQGAVWMAGRFAGGITPLVVLAMLMQTTTAAGETVVVWRHVFWGFGLLGIVWCVIFWFWFRDRPEQKSGVNQAEIALIHGDEKETEDSHRGVPWRKLLTSANLWILCAMYFCAAYGWYFNITWLPGYLRDRYGVTRETWGFWTTSFMAGAPLLIGALACLVGGLLTDFFIRRTGNRKWGRRLFGVVGHGICAMCYFASIWADNAWMFVLAITTATFWNDMTMGSAWASCIDIGKRFSGIVSGCMNTIGNLGGAVAGFVTGWILQDSAEIVQFLGNLGLSLPSMMLDDPGWKINFLSYALVYALATLFWMRFDSTRPIVTETATADDPPLPADEPDERIQPPPDQFRERP